MFITLRQYDYLHHIPMLGNGHLIALLGYVCHIVTLGFIHYIVTLGCVPHIATMSYDYLNWLISHRLTVTQFLSFVLDKYQGLKNRNGGNFVYKIITL
jgi:hypothetical protein